MAEAGWPKSAVRRRGEQPVRGNRRGMQIFTPIQLVVAALSGLCFLVAGGAAVLHALIGTCPQDTSLEHEGTTQGRPLVYTPRVDQGSALR
jgi:hypothetical protein